MNYTELRKLSLEFRRLSSNLLCSNDDNADVNLSRFLKYINQSDFISNVINQKITGVEYDFRECFLIETRGWSDFNIPTDEAQHIKAQYDYMVYINDTEKVSVRNQALSYCWAENNISEMIQKFLDAAFKTFIDYINDQISMEMIVMDEERKNNIGNTFIQNIETVHGSANQQVNGIINNYNNGDSDDILKLIDKILPSLSLISEVDSEEVDSVQDDLEMVQEQLKTKEPKKSRIRKALSGIKKFAKDFSMKLAVSVATNVVTGTDWNMLIQQLENFVNT